MNRNEIINQLKKQEVFIITHIPKTSGSSLSYLLRQQKSDVFWPHYEKTDGVPEYISGHICYGIHELWKLDEKKVKYLVILRDPIKRWKSIFNYSLMRYHEGVIRKGIPIDIFYNFCDGNLEKFLERCIKNGSNQNIMTKVVSGGEDVSNIKDYQSYRQKKGRLYFSNVSQTAWGDRINCISSSKMEDMIAVAKSNLLDKYYFVGFVEDKNNQQKMCEVLNLKFYGKSIVKRKSTQRKEINWENNNIRDMLIELNKYDIDLYDFAINNVVDFKEYK